MNVFSWSLHTESECFLRHVHDAKVKQRTTVPMSVSEKQKHRHKQKIIKMDVENSEGHFKNLLRPKSMLFTVICNI